MGVLARLRRAVLVVRDIRLSAEDDEVRVRNGDTAAGMLLRRAEARKKRAKRVAAAVAAGLAS